MIGRVLAGRFEIRGPLGAGRKASVWRAHDRDLGTEVAIKLLHPHIARDPEARRRLRREVLAARRVAGAVAVYDLVVAVPDVFLVEELMSGGDLARRLAEDGPVPIVDVIRWGVSVARVLEGAHRQGVLHRDLRPSKLMLDASGAARVGDFGLARVAGQATATAALAGAIGYAAPELYEGTRDDPRSDGYALAASLYELATGRRPHDAGTPEQTLDRQLAGEIVDNAHAIPGPLGSVLRRELARSPEDRFPTLGAFADALLAAEQGQSTAPTGIGLGCVGCGAGIVIGLPTCPRCGARRVAVPRHPGGAYRVHVVSPIGLQGVTFGRPLDPFSLEQKQRIVATVTGLVGQDLDPDSVKVDLALARPRVCAADALDEAGADRLVEALRAAGFHAYTLGPGRPGEPWGAHFWRFAPFVPLMLFGLLQALVTGADRGLHAGALVPVVVFGLIGLVLTRRSRPISLLSPAGTTPETPLSERVLAAFAEVRSPDARERVADVLRAAAVLRADLETLPEVARREALGAVEDTVNAALVLGQHLGRIEAADRERVGAAQAELLLTDEVALRTRLLGISADIRAAAAGIHQGAAHDAVERARIALSRLHLAERGGSS